MEHRRTRLKDLLLLLLHAMDDRDDAPAITATDLRDLVMAAGLDEEDLDALIHGLHQMVDEDEPSWLAAQRLSPPSSAALRQPAAHEDAWLTVPAFGYLLELVRTHQISSEQMETLVQYAQLAPGAPLTPTDLSAMLDRVVFADRSPGVRPVADWYGPRLQPGETPRQVH